MNKLLIPTLIVTAVFSANAFADRDWDDGYRDRNRGHHRHHKVERVVVQTVYAEPEIIYQAPPVVYRDRIVYRDRPVYYEAEPRYVEPRYVEPRYQERQERPVVYAGDSSNRFVGQALGAIAGGALGSQVGRGNGRIAATAIGAVIGSALGGNAAYPGY